MEDFFKKEDYTQADIEALIANSIEEGYYLDFKRAESLDPKDEKKKTEISKDVCCFANTYGGIIVYGVEEKDHVASNYSFIDGKEITKEWLGQLIQGRIQKQIPDLKIYPIRFDKKFEKTIYLVKIPQSVDAPHMAYDGRFYKRDNFNIIRMSELDVRNTYNRLTKGNLEIAEVRFNQDSHGGNVNITNTVNYTIRFYVENIGNTIENNLKFEISIPDIIYNPLSYRENELNNFLTKQENGILTFSFYYDKNIYPEEEILIKALRIQLDNRKKNLIKTVPLKMTLFHSGGAKKSEVNLYNLLTVNSKPLSEANFGTR